MYKLSDFKDYEEINTEAGKLLAGGKTAELMKLAEANGLSKEDVEDYVDGLVDMFCTETTAALGKLTMECKELKLEGILADWHELVYELCLEDKQIAASARSNDKTLAGCMSRILRSAFEHKVQVCDEIVDITMVNHNGKEEKMRKPLYIGIPSRAECRQIIRDYYGGAE